MFEPESTVGIKKPSRGRSAKAGLIMPVSKVDRRIKAVSRRSSGTAAVYLAAVLENIVGELFQAAVNQTDRGKHGLGTQSRVATRFSFHTAVGLARCICNARDLHTF